MDNQTPPTDKVVKIGNYNVQVIRNLCIGAGSCIAVSPITYVLDSQSKAIILENSTESPDNIVLSAQSCPTKAIIVTDATTNQQVWPV